MKQDQEAQLIARVAGNIYGNFYQERVTPDIYVSDDDARQAARQSVAIATVIVRLSLAAAS